MKKLIALVIPAALVCTVFAQDGGRAAAQAGAGRGMGAPAVVSPEVHPDRTVTLRIAAPLAKTVTVSGEITGTKPPAPLTLGADGVWSVTLGPLEPDDLLLRLQRGRRDGQRPADVLRETEFQLHQPGGGCPETARSSTMPSRFRTATCASSSYEAKTLDGRTRRMRVYTPARVRERQPEVPGPVPVPRRGGLGCRVDRRGPRQPDPRQPDRGGQSQADDRGHAVHLPAGRLRCRCDDSGGAARGHAGRWRRCAGRCCSDTGGGRTRRHSRRWAGRCLHEGAVAGHHAAGADAVPHAHRPGQHGNRRTVHGRGAGVAHRTGPHGGLPLRRRTELRGWPRRGPTGSRSGQRRRRRPASRSDRRLSPA